MLTGACTIAFLLPWMVLAVIAIGTPLYPLIQGNVRPDYGFVGSLHFDEKVRWALTNLFVFKPVGTIGMLFAAAVLLPGSRRNRVLHAFLLASVIAFCLMIHFFQNFQDPDSIARYYFAFALAFGLTVTLAALSQAARRTAGVLPAAALVLFAVGYQFVATKDQVLTSATSGVTAFNNILWQRGPSKPHEKAGLYKRIQDSIPPGERVLVMLDHTHLLDGKRNVFLTFDHPCGAGPKPGRHVRRAGGDGRVSDATADPLPRLPARAVVAGVQHPPMGTQAPGRAAAQEADNVLREAGDL